MRKAAIRLSAATMTGLDFYMKMPVRDFAELYNVSAPVRFCNFSPNKECKKTAGEGVQPLNNYTCRFRPSSLKCTDKSGLDGLQADKWISG